MLAYVLAFLVGSGSLALYMAAFFFPEVHRKNDFIWSGVGLFYALVLWVCAGRITGGVLLGQMAGVTLLGWLGWQTFLLRRQVAPLEQQTPLPTGEDLRAALGNLSSSEGRSQLAGQVSRTLRQVKDGIGGAIASATQKKTAVTAAEFYVPPKLEEFGTAGEEAIERFAKAAIPVELAPELDPAAVNLAELDPEKTVKDVVTEAIGQVDAAADTMTSAVNEAARAVAASENQSAGAFSTLSQRANNTIKVLTGTVQSLIQSFTKKKESKPTYVRKEFREESPSRASTQVTVTDATVVEVLEDVAATTKAEGALVADVAIEIVSDDLAPDLLATSLSDNTPSANAIEPIEAAETIADEIGSDPTITDATIVADLTLEAEMISDRLVPDLLTTTLSDATAETIVEDLLEDISAQEEMPEVVHQSDSNNLTQM